MRHQDAKMIRSLAYGCGAGWAKLPCVAPDVLAALEAVGHTLMARRHGNIHALTVDPVTGLFTGIAEPRRVPRGAAVGY